MATAQEIKDLLAKQAAAAVAPQQNPLSDLPPPSPAAVASVVNPATAELQRQLADALQTIAELNAAAMQAQQVKTGVAATGKGTLKAYFNTMPFCNIHVMRGPGYCEELRFTAGMLETDDLQVQAHLDTVCDKPGSQITSAPQTAVSQEEQRMRADVRASAEIARQKMIDAGEKTV